MKKNKNKTNCSPSTRRVFFKFVSQTTNQKSSQLQNIYHEQAMRHRLRNELIKFNNKKLN